MGRESYKLPFAPREEDETDDPFIPSTTPQSSNRLGLKLPKVKKITVGSLWNATLEFFSNPVNVAIFVWMLLTVPACSVIGLDYAGLWKKLVTDEHEAAKWVEICTQVVNCLFVLMCLVVTPVLTRHAIQLVRWRPADKIELRAFYCKNGTRKPHDRSHIGIVVFFGHLTCWATFAFSIVFWLYPIGHRPAWLVNITFGASWLAPIISLFYLLLSPLSRNYDIIKDSDALHLRMYERSSAFVVEDRMVGKGLAQWSGKICPGCCADRRVALCVSVFPCCMFGYNMERLGFGHRAVHTSAFMVVLVGPMLVFALSAAALSHLGVPWIVLFLAGVGVGVSGLAYGGLWRMKMRARYGLPGSWFGDICAWMWCGLCALCQEIRTADQYEVEEASTWKLQVGASKGLFPTNIPPAIVEMEDEDRPYDEYGEMKRPRVSFSRAYRSGVPVRKEAPEPDEY